MTFLWLVLACTPSDAPSGDNPLPPPDDDTDIIDTDGGDDTSPIVDTSGPCSGFPALATVPEMNSTPRPDNNLERLAIQMDGLFIASQATYDRVERDILGIRNTFPSVGHIEFFEPNDGVTLLMGADSLVLDDMEAGTYEAWDCHNQRYELATETYSFYAKLVFGGNYDMALLAAEYAALPGVDYAEPNGIIGDGPTICGTIDGTMFHYVFDDASGDCFSGCMMHEYRYFTTDSAGAISDQGTWSNTSNTAAPQWVSQFGSCP
jgi:hypothetical protein